MEYQVHMRYVAPQLTAVVRLRARQPELATVIPAACGEVWAFARSAGLPRPGRHLALYLDCEMNIECGAEVFQPFAGNGRVVCSSTPAGLVATAAHLGPYARLGEAHAAIHRWCAENGHTLAGPSWEVYGHWDDDPAKLRTDVFYLLQPAGGLACPSPSPPQGPDA
jgi:effector-binding domain-containing protein